MSKSSYTTTQGDSWDTIAFKIWGQERMMHHLLRSNPEYFDVLIFPAGVLLNVPDLQVPKEKLELPPWMNQ